MALLSMLLWQNNVAAVRFSLYFLFIAIPALNNPVLAQPSFTNANSNNSPATAILQQQQTGGASAASNCVDSEPKCALWASQGECQSNAIWMMSNCRRSCNSCQGGDRAWQLRSKLIQNYENSSSTAASPSGTSGGGQQQGSNVTRIVRIDSLRVQGMEIDESREQARVFGKLVLSWNDSKVSWEPAEFGGLTWLNFYWAQVWTPQLVQINVPNPSPPGQIQGKVLAANYTGQVWMWTDFNFVAPFHFEYEDFPRDRQRICYQFDDKRYLAVKFLVSSEVRSRQHESIADSHVSGWEIVDVDVSESKHEVEILGDWHRNPFDIQTTNCELCVELSRNAVFWFAEMLCPAMVTSVCTLAAVLFQLALPQAGMLALSLVAQMLSLQLINARLPSYSSGAVPSILKFSSFNLICTTTLLLISLCLRRLAQHNPNIPLPRPVYAMIAWLDRVIPLPKGGKDLSEENGGAAAIGGCCYADIALTLNNLCFAVFAFLYIWTLLTSFVF